MNYYLNAGTNFHWKYTYNNDIVNKKGNNNKQSYFKKKDNTRIS